MIVHRGVDSITAIHTPGSITSLFIASDFLRLSPSYEDYEFSPNSIFHCPFKQRIPCIFDSAFNAVDLYTANRLIMS